MARIGTKQLIRSMIHQFNDEKRYNFVAIGKGGQYSEAQKPKKTDLVKI